jgi:hypothetical protein
LIRQIPGIEDPGEAGPRQLRDDLARTGEGQVVDFDAVPDLVRNGTPEYPPAPPAPRRTSMSIAESSRRRSTLSRRDVARARAAEPPVTD